MDEGHAEFKVSSTSRLFILLGVHDTLNILYCSVTNTDELKSKMPELEDLLNDQKQFREFYTFTFPFAKTKTQKSMDVDVSTEEGTHMKLLFCSYDLGLALIHSF